MDDMWTTVLFILGIGIGIGVVMQLWGMQSTIHNKEVWEWVDWTGQKRSIEVNRVVD